MGWLLGNEVPEFKGGANWVEADKNEPGTAVASIGLKWTRMSPEYKEPVANPSYTTRSQANLLFNNQKQELKGTKMYQ